MSICLIYWMSYPPFFVLFWRSNSRQWGSTVLGKIFLDWSKFSLRSRRQKECVCLFVCLFCVWESNTNWLVFCLWW
jgi:hypothetical protein